MGIFNSFAGLASILTALMGPSTPPSTEVCFGSVGCFSNALPCHTLDMSPPEDINVRFYLFTRRNLNKRQEISWRDVTSIESSHFNHKHPTKFIIHGWIENTQKSAFINMKNALIRNDHVNVIMVDWRGGSLDIYDTSVQNTRVVGREIAILARKLHRLFKAPLSSMHAIGHSLGAHIAGYAGSELPGFGRITAMDPAGPRFQGTHLHHDCKVDRTDALFVDAIHTDGTDKPGIIMGMNGLGLQEQVGHQDFYPNGGKHMPGCLPITHCSHVRAVFYFTSSISTCSYEATNRCDTYKFIDSTRQNCTTYENIPNTRQHAATPRMGYWADPADGEGAYYLRTAGSFPYC